jgi:hypothetical protein
MGALSDPFDPDKILWAGCPCGAHASMWEHQIAMANGGNGDSRFYCMETGEEAAEASRQQPQSRYRGEAGPANAASEKRAEPNWDCPASAFTRQNGVNEKWRISGIMEQTHQISLLH